ncbi:MAG: chemotaxis response regulator protein-glutamate methylesterase [Phycisphaerales bacterium JB065]
MIKVLVCDDSAFMRRAISTMLTSDSDVRVIDFAKNGREAVEMAIKHQPDIITMDVEMPEMDGLTALREIMAKSPTQVIMLSSLTTEGSRAAMQALRLGAADVLAKDQSLVSTKIMGLRDELLRRVHALAEAGRPRAGKVSAPASTSIPSYRPGRFNLIVIGSSTGGPPVLETILSQVSAKSRVPIIVAQHMPAVFTKSMAERLNGQCQVPVRHAEDRMPVEPGAIHICPGGLNTHIGKAGSRLTLRMNREPEDTVYYPSANVLFDSAAKAVGRHALAIVLTGMGEDGVVGARSLVDAGGTVLAQSAETCVVYGMPKAVTQAAIATESLSPTQLAELLAEVTAPVSCAA